jgi:hypothetical protein
MNLLTFLILFYHNTKTINQFFLIELFALNIETFQNILLETSYNDGYRYIVDQIGRRYYNDGYRYIVDQIGRRYI